MSLDVYLLVDEPVTRPSGSGIFIRENGSTKEISEEEWYERFPYQEPVRLKVPQTEETREVFSWNITHNLTEMAQEAGLYEVLWHPERIDPRENIPANALILPMVMGLDRLKQDPERFQKFNPKNNWGSYATLVNFVEKYLAACIEFPNATVKVWG